MTEASARPDCTARQLASTIAIPQEWSAAAGDGSVDYNWLGNTGMDGRVGRGARDKAPEGTPSLLVPRT